MIALLCQIHTVCVKTARVTLIDLAQHTHTHDEALRGRVSDDPRVWASIKHKHSAASVGNACAMALPLLVAAKVGDKDKVKSEVLRKGEKKIILTSVEFDALHARARAQSQSC